MKLTTTRKAATKVKILVYGQAGMGKTTLCGTAPKPLIISAEGGMLSLADKDLPVIEVTSTSDIYEALEYVQSKKGKKFKTICLDSVSDIAEVVLNDLKKESKDPRKAYGNLADEMMELIRAFRDLKSHHVYMTAKAKRAINDEGDERFFPSMPGQQLITNLPYMFDEVLALRIWKDEDGDEYRYLQTQPDYYYEAKDRSGKLKAMEKPDLNYIFRKITGGD
jgi:phage nucleotide-binding protein